MSICNKELTFTFLGILKTNDWMLKFRLIY